MCYKLHQITQCPGDGITTLAELMGQEDTIQHDVWSVIRCSSPKPCSGDGFGTLTKIYQDKDYCQNCLGSVIAARAPDADDVTSQWRLNENTSELLDNITNYADHLLSFGLLALHESLPPAVLTVTPLLYPPDRLLATALWETYCVRCKVQIDCGCRPGRNENSWSVARHIRTRFTKDALVRLHNRTSVCDEHAAETVRVRDGVHAAIDAAVAAVGGDIIYDVGPVDEADAERRFGWVARDMLDEYRGPGRDPPFDADPEAQLAAHELTVKLDLVELLASVVAHDTGVPDSLVRALGSRLLPVVMLTRQQLAQNVAAADARRNNRRSLRGRGFRMSSSDDNNGLPYFLPHDLGTRYDATALAYDGWGDPARTLNVAPVALPLAGLVRDGLFFPSLLDMVRREGEFLRGLYAAPDPAVVLALYVVVNDDDPTGPSRRFQGGFEANIRMVQFALRAENAEMNAYEANRLAWWRVLLREVQLGVQFLTKGEMPPAFRAPNAATDTDAQAPQCFVHLAPFWLDLQGNNSDTMEMEEFRLDVNGGAREPQPRHTHRPIRLANCVRSQNPHAFCMVSLAEWVFQRDVFPHRRVRITRMRDRACVQCRRRILADDDDDDMVVS